MTQPLRNTSSPFLPTPPLHAADCEALSEYVRFCGSLAYKSTIVVSEALKIRPIVDIIDTHRPSYLAAEPEQPIA